MSKMNPERKAEWVAALRSEKFLQGMGVLVSVDTDGKVRHCCLGVLCELAAMAGAATRHPGGFYGNGDECRFTLPQSVQEWAGITTEVDEDSLIPACPRAGGLELSELNDTGVGFSEIADIIEREM